jgi:hypothetical protein
VTSYPRNEEEGGTLSKLLARERGIEYEHSSTLDTQPETKIKETSLSDCTKMTYTAILDATLLIVYISWYG